MTTDVQATASPTPIESGPGLIPYRLTVDQFLAMIDAGVFPERPRVELIRGLLVERMTKNNPHNFAVDTLGDLLQPLVAPGYLVRREKSLVIGRGSRPEPDVFVLRGPRDLYRARDPRAADVALIVEIADTTYRKDRGAMWRLYAGAGIPTYWVVNLPDRQVEVYTNPSGRGKSATYREAAVFGADAAVPVVIEGREAGSIAVKEILP
jgi:Uma2 family endonuclease